MRLVLTFGKDREREGRRDRERKIKLLIKSSLILLLTFFYLPIQDLWGGPQDDRGVRWGDYLPPHRHINNSSEYGTNPTEQLLNARRPQTSKKCKPISLERGRTKDKDIKETKNFRTGLVGGVGLCPEGGKESRSRKSSCALGSSLTGGSRGSCGISESWAKQRLSAGVLAPAGSRGTLRMNGVGERETQ